MHRLSPTLLFVCALLAFGPRPAHGFTIGSPLSRGCHERITAEALRRARELIGAPPAIAPTADERALIDDLPFHLDPALRDLAGAALTLAVRDPDTGGMSVRLLDVYGAPRGSVGPFAALSPLGIDVDLGRGWRFVLDPVVLVLPVPHVTGLPFYYPQYRLSAAFQFGS